MCSIDPRDDQTHCEGLTTLPDQLASTQHRHRITNLQLEDTKLPSLVSYSIASRWKPLQSKIQINIPCKTCELLPVDEHLIYLQQGDRALKTSSRLPRRIELISWDVEVEHNVILPTGHEVELSTELPKSSTKVEELRRKKLAGV